MTLTDQYLNAVSQFLPRAQRKDILQELSENIRAQLEDQEAELGRPLSEAEQAAILQRHGTPLEVASQYRPTGQSVVFGRPLIGPALFPLYCIVLALNLVVALVVSLGLAMAQVDSSDGGLMSILSSLLLRFAIVTVIFALAQRHVSRHPEYWNARIWPAAETSDRRRVSRFESFAQLVALAVFLSWIHALRHTGLPAAADQPHLAPVWGQVYWPVVLLSLVGIAQACINLARPHWVRFCWIVRVAMDLGWLAVLGYLTFAGAWVVPPQAGESLTAKQLEFFAAVNQGCSYSLVIAVVVSLLIAFYDVRRHVREIRIPAGADGQGR